MCLCEHNKQNCTRATFNYDAKYLEHLRPTFNENEDGEKCINGRIEHGKTCFLSLAIGLGKERFPASYASNIQHKGNAQIMSMVNLVCSEGTHCPLIWSEAVFRAVKKKTLLFHTIALFSYLLTDNDNPHRHCSHTCTHGQTFSFQRQQDAYNTSSTAQGGGGNFNSRKPIREISCCDSRMAQQKHWWMEVSKWQTDWLTTWQTD